MRRLGILLLATAACGGSGDASAPPAPAAVDPSTVSLAADPMDRPVVAKVNGVPIYADCVERQAEAHGLGARAALDECIDFELLAQAADAAGYRTDPAVLEARKNEAARRLIDREFAAHFDGPEDIPLEDVRRTYEALKGREWVYDEHREMSYYRFQTLNERRPNGLPDAEAKALAETLYAKFAGRTDVTHIELLEAGRALNDTYGAIHYPDDPLYFPRNGVVPEYQKVLFDDMQTEGAVSPPTQTRWGWDVILLIKIFPAKNVSFEEAEPEVREKAFEAARQRAFTAFTDKLLGAKPETNEYWLERLAKADIAERSLLGGGGG